MRAVGHELAERTTKRMELVNAYSSVGLWLVWRQYNVKNAFGLSFAVISIGGYTTIPFCRDAHVDMVSRITLETVSSGTVGKDGRVVFVRMPYARLFWPKL
jgi:hypothetical protein